MSRARILFFHPSGLFYGGTERLLQIFAKTLSQSHDVFYMYSPKGGEQRRDYFVGSQVTLIPFTYAKKQAVEPYVLQGMKPEILSVIREHRIQVVCTPVSAHYQFPLNVIPASMPFILTSPFGHYATNGNVRMVYVSGSDNLLRLQKRGVKTAELIYDPLEDFPAWVTNRSPISSVITFGRLGRPDDQIFDPVAIRAFARLERKYGDRVKYLVLSPPPKMVALAAELDVRNFVVVDERKEHYWEHFYHDIDVLAHARLDGETFGKAIAEAMLSGVPIVTHRSHYHNEHLNVVRSDFARWSEPDDVDGYYKNLEWFVEHSQEIRALGELARKRALELFDPEVILAPIINEFENAAAASTFFKRGSWVLGYSRLGLANMRMIPFVLAKLLAHHFAWFRKIAIRLYTKRPLY